MRVLLTGQTGFIGSHLRSSLLRRGHEVPEVPVDLGAANGPDIWLPHLAAVHVVVNAAGIFRESRPGDFARVNQVGPCALFRAAEAASVSLIIQLSALGADEGAKSRFHLSKRAADECLRSVAVASCSLQPSLVFGMGGASAGLMNTLASLPIIPLPGGGAQRVQPIHIDDLVEVVVRLIEFGPHNVGSTIALVGPRAVSVREYLCILRHSMGMSPAWFVPMPMPLVQQMARAAAQMRNVPVDPEALEMLERGNTAAVRDAQEVLGRTPRDPACFIPPSLASGLRTQAVLEWLLPLLRGSIALMWLWAAVVSVGFHPVADSYRMLAATGVPPNLLPFALYGAAAMDLVLGLLTLAPRRSRLLWQVQIVLVLSYTVVITISLPEYLTHPFGPIVKNLPILVALWMLAKLEPVPPRPRVWNT